MTSYDEVFRSDNVMIGRSRLQETARVPNPLLGKKARNRKPTAVSKNKA